MKFSRLLVALAVSTTLAAGATALAQEGSVAEDLTVAPEPGDSPEIGAFGFDLEGMNRTVAPGEDFYAFANGTWAETTPIPADRSNYGMFTLLEELSQQRTRTILEEAQADPASKIGNAYASFLDEVAVEQAGLTPLQPWIDRVMAVETKGDYAALAGQASRYGVPGPIGMYVNQDDRLPDQYALFMVQSGLGMPDRDYYLSDAPAIVETRGKYLTHMANMLRLAGEENAEARAQAILDYETQIAQGHWTRVQSRDATATYNKMAVSQLAASAPGFDFARYFEGSGVSPEELIVSQPSAVTAIAAAVEAAPLEVLRDALLVRSLDEYAPYLSSAFVNENFDFYGTALSGTPELEPRWKRGVRFVTETMGEAVGEQYVARYFPPEAKAAADELVRNVIAAMDQRLANLEWMAPETRARAREKLAGFTPKIGYPETWRDYSALTIERDDLVGNAMRAAEFEHQRNLNKLGGPVDRGEWFMTPMTVNAYANPTMNEIVFPAAILQPPFFDPNADPAINYGGIGAVIGHEISHHFDDQGRKYNAEGALAEWWTPEDVERFEALAQELVAQYDLYEGLPGLQVQGALTLGENIADLAGLTVAHQAYRASLGGAEPPVLEGLTGDQRFYLGWAQVWRRNYREENLRQRLLTDPHSPSRQRTWVVRNLDPWYQAYDVQPGARLYLAPEDRVRIW